jgi:hypothetical protein
METNGIQEFSAMMGPGGPRAGERRRLLYGLSAVYVYFKDFKFTTLIKNEVLAGIFPGTFCNLGFSRFQIDYRFHPHTGSVEIPFQYVVRGVHISSRV